MALRSRARRSRSRSSRIDKAILVTCPGGQGETVMGTERGRLPGGGSIGNGPWGGGRVSGKVVESRRGGGAANFIT